MKPELKYEAVGRLVDYGYLETRGDVGEARLEVTVRKYQANMGLDVNGKLDNATVRHLREWRFCGVPDNFRLGAQQDCSWSRKVADDLTWTITGWLDEFSREKLRAIYTEAWKYWSDVCNITPRYVSQVNQAWVRMGSGHIDNSAGTLAWSELPCGSDRALTQKYDTGEHWVDSDRPTRNTIDLVRVAAHEIGHVIGLNHGAEGTLLAPTYSTRIRKPQAGDIARVQKIYGKPKTKPADPPTQPPAGGSHNVGVRIDVDVDGSKYTGAGTLKRAGSATFDEEGLGS